MDAVQEVHNSKRSISEVARQFKVPRTTLRDHVTGKTKDFTMGAKRMLCEDLETILVDYIRFLQRQNFPVRRSDVRLIVIVSKDKTIFSIAFCVWV